MGFKPRQAQAEILKYTNGTMGIAAVPGSGKTHTLSALAADLVEKLLKSNQDLDSTIPPQEVLVVTFSNAAVNNFSARIGAFLEDRGMIRGIGYKVCTLHSMALEIISGHTEQLGIPNEFTLLDEVNADHLLSEAVNQWLKKDDRATFDAFVNRSYRPEKREKHYQEDWSKAVQKIARNVISQAKDYHLMPEELRREMSRFSEEKNYPLIEMVADIYTSYQNMLRNTPAMDFSDLMFNAYRILKAEPNYLKYLQNRWPYILEDEAQDSSQIQEEVLRLLTAENHNWVRVGDTNQAINETFTTSDPRFLREFLKEADHTVELKQAGRSSRSILAQANHLIHWVTTGHPNPEIRKALSLPYVRMTDPGDPQGNPNDAPERVYYDPKQHPPVNEIETVCRAAAAHVQQHPDETVAILVLKNDYGKQIVEKLETFPVEVIEVLKSTKEARTASELLESCFLWLSMPTDKEKMTQLFDKIYNDRAKGEFWLPPSVSSEIRQAIQGILLLEDFFYPLSKEALSAVLAPLELSFFAKQVLFRFRYFLKRWLEGRFLPVDQLVLLIAQDIFDTPDDLSIAGAMGNYLMQTTRMQPGLSLTSLAGEIGKISNNASLYAMLSGAEKEFNPELYRGKIVVTTYHKSKGLEWDQVYMTTCNTFDFPNGMDDKKNNKGNPGYVRDQLSLEAEALEMMKVIAGIIPEYEDGKGSERSQLNNAMERLRLLFVGITRAKKGLNVSWNTGTFNNYDESLAVKYLREQWNRK